MSKGKENGSSTGSRSNRAVKVANKLPRPTCLEVDVGEAQRIKMEKKTLIRVSKGSSVLQFTVEHSAEVNVKVVPGCVSGKEVDIAVSGEAPPKIKAQRGLRCQILVVKATHEKGYRNEAQYLKSLGIMNLHGHPRHHLIFLHRDHRAAFKAAVLSPACHALEAEENAPKHVDGLHNSFLYGNADSFNLDLEQRGLRRSVNPQYRAHPPLLAFPTRLSIDSIYCPVKGTAYAPPHPPEPHLVIFIETGNRAPQASKGNQSEAIPSAPSSPARTMTDSQSPEDDELCSHEESSPASSAAPRRKRERPPSKAKKMRWNDGAVQNGVAGIKVIPCMSPRPYLSSTPREREKKKTPLVIQVCDCAVEQVATAIYTIPGQSPIPVIASCGSSDRT